MSRNASRKMHLIGYYTTGPTAGAYAIGTWRHPDARVDDVFDFSYYERVAQIAEAAYFDGIFVADSYGLNDVYGKDHGAAAKHGIFGGLDPVVAVAAMARATKHVGVGATISTTFFSPFQIARQLASLDLVSGGRVAWNVVTSAADFEAKNFGMEELPDKVERYDRADEVLEACMGLWASWAEDAVVMDKESGVFARPGSITAVNYVGKYVSTTGPLSLPRSRQAHPVIMQAGSSGRGREFAAKWAEVIFFGDEDRQAALEFRSDIHDRMRAIGRDPRDCKILSRISVVVDSTQEGAERKAEEINRHSSVEARLTNFSGTGGVDLSDRDAIAARNSSDQRVGIDIYRDFLGRTDTDAAAAADQAVAKLLAVSEKHLIGTPATVCDELQDRFESGACDGFILNPALNDVSFRDFGEQVTPELQRRGLLRKSYTGTTLRENLGDDR